GHERENDAVAEMHMIPPVWCGVQALIEVRPARAIPDGIGHARVGVIVERENAPGRRRRSTENPRRDWSFEARETRAMFTIAILNGRPIARSRRARDRSRENEIGARSR